ncbi:MAG: VTT domain-containing protein [bacterium]|nr:VTT domain-containing protein [bacterium]
MIESLISYIQSIIFQYGAWGVFFATIMEEVIAPIPSPIVPLAAGFFLLSPDASLAAVIIRSVLVIALPVAVGIGIGSSLVYVIGYFGGKPVIEKNKKWLGLEWSDVEKVEKKIIKGKGDEITIFILRVLPIIPGVAISGFCGVVRYPFYNFITITFAGAFVRALILGVLGWQVGEFYQVYADNISRFEEHILFGTLAVIAVGGIIYYFFRKRKRN